MRFVFNLGIVVLILSAFSIIKAEEVPPQNDIPRPPQTETITDAQRCEVFLERTQDGLASYLDERMTELTEIENCMTAQTISPECNSHWQDIQENIPNYNDYRIDLGLLDIGFTPVDGDLLSVGQHNGGFRNLLRLGVDPLREQEQTRVWSEYETFQREFLPVWWQENIPNRYPNWRQCVNTDGENNLGWISKRERHLLEPDFIEDRLPRNLRQHQEECDSLRLFFSNDPHGVALAQQMRLRRHPVSDQRLENFQPFMYFLRQSLEGRNEIEVRTEVARAHNRLRTDLGHLKSWIEDLEVDQREKLLAFDEVQSLLGENSFCEGYSRLGWNDVTGFATEIGLSLIPGYNFYNNMFNEVPLNNAAFLAGFIGEESRQENHDGLTQGAAQSLALAPFQAAIEAQVMTRVMKVAGPSLSSTARATLERLNNGMDRITGGRNPLRRATPGSGGRLDDLGAEITDNGFRRMARSRNPSEGYIPRDIRARLNPTQRAQLLRMERNIANLRSQAAQTARSGAADALERSQRLASEMQKIYTLLGYESRLIMLPAAIDEIPPIPERWVLELLTAPDSAVNGVISRFGENGQLGVFVDPVAADLAEISGYAETFTGRTLEHFRNTSGSEVNSSYTVIGLEELPLDSSRISSNYMLLHETRHAYFRRALEERRPTPYYASFRAAPNASLDVDLNGAYSDFYSIDEMTAYQRTLRQMISGEQTGTDIVTRSGLSPPSNLSMMPGSDEISIALNNYTRISESTLRQTNRVIEGLNRNSLNFDFDLDSGVVRGTIEVPDAQGRIVALMRVHLVNSTDPNDPRNREYLRGYLAQIAETAQMHVRDAANYTRPN
jgi:hypothetical protein